jgi:CRP/FNR family transcriptional regulator, cyclic AMP receptor protein
MLKPTVALLKEVGLFKTLSDTELQQLISMGANTQYEEHSNVIIEGELSWGLFVVLEGMVGVYKLNKLTGDHFEVAQIKAGGFFGELSLVDDDPRAATIRCTTPCTLLQITKEQFTAFLNQSTDLKSRFYLSTIRSLIGRLRELDDNYVISQYQLWHVALRKGDSSP